jgi:NADPH:quinone reductase-like Zn-dependent oxidoreductase
LKRSALYFSNPREVQVREERVPGLTTGQLLVKSLLSAISPGTELLVYHQEVPDDVSVDQNIRSLPGSFSFPMKYGYSIVGKVIAAAKGVEESWLDKTVFAFHPHESLFAAFPEELMILPDGVSQEDAVFFPNMETAVSLVMDGQPLIGERALVIGQGIVGLLTTCLLGKYPLERLITIDRYEIRRINSLLCGASASFDADGKRGAEQIKFSSQVVDGFDLVFELSGNPEALDQAIALTGFDGRIIVGSWYGKKTSDLNLGGRFHRSRIKLISSQVSSLAPGLTGRWNKERRSAIVWQMIKEVRPSRFISRRMSIGQAPQAYRLLDNAPDKVLQITLSY